VQLNIFNGPDPWRDVRLISEFALDKCRDRVRFPTGLPILMNTVSCQRLSDFMKTEMEVIQKHLDEHKYLRGMDDKGAALASFINDYGWLIRELYCTKICDQKNICEISMRMSSSGDLLRDHVK
jgi:hypothetical protein